MFKTQLRALLRASVYGQLAIMLPMITDVGEIRRTKVLIEEAKTQLRASEQPYSDNIEIGVMIETPAAAVLSDLLAPEADFFSIGTNDLEQYTLAMDRQNMRLESYCPNNHTALLRLMKTACDNAHKYGKWVGICGELGGDLSLAGGLSGYGNRRNISCSAAHSSTEKQNKNAGSSDKKECT